MAKSKCEVQGCDKDVVAYGLCDMHRKRLSRHGHLKQTRAKDWGKREKHSLYNTWNWMRRMQYKYSIEPRWQDFWKFVKDVGERPSPKYQLRRIDIHEGYSSNNFNWVEVIPGRNKAEYAKEWRRKNPDLVKNNELRKSFGITLEDYNRMREEQNGVCAICGQIDDNGFSLAVDHCHTTKKVRGLLCANCNRGLGIFNDSIDLLTKAINYLN